MGLIVGIFIGVVAVLLLVNAVLELGSWAIKNPRVAMALFVGVFVFIAMELLG